MAEYAVMPAADYKDACDAVREKTGGTAVIKSGQMGSLIRGISGGEGTPYDGSYEVVPKVETQVLPTKQKYLDEDVTVLAVPFYEVDNQKGTTIFIASEV